MPEMNAAESVQDGQEQVNAEDQELAQDAEGSESEAAQKPTDDERRRKGGYLRKLEKAERQAEFWREEALRNRNGQEKKPDPVVDDKPPVKPVRPKMDDFPIHKYESAEKAYAAYEEAKDKFEESRDEYYEKKLAWELRQNEAKTQQKTVQQQIADDWATRVAEAKGKYSDFEQVAFSEDVPMSNAMMNAIVKHKLGAEIAYELGQNPDEAERIAKLEPVDAVMEIGVIGSRIANKSAAAEKEEEEEPAPAAASRAPKPPSPVRRGAAANTDPSDSDDYKTWLKKREAQLARK